MKTKIYSLSTKKALFNGVLEENSIELFMRPLLMHLLDVEMHKNKLRNNNVIDSFEEDLDLDELLNFVGARKIQKYSIAQVCKADSHARAVWLLREVFAELQRLETPWLTPDIHPFLRDTYDHIVQVVEIVESLRELLAGLTDLYLSQLSHRMNEIMKLLTLVGTIFIPLTFIAGVYGMNFAYMPELQWRYGYPTIMLLMLVLAIGMLYGFRRKRWI